MLFLHIAAAVLGIVSSTLRSLLFVKKGVLNPYLQRVTLISLFILSVTGIGLLLAKPVLLHDPAFWIKMFFVGTLLVAEASLAFKKSRWAAFVTLFSWYYSFLWSGLERLNFGYVGVLGVYFTVVFLSFFLARKYGYT